MKKRSRIASILLVVVLAIAMSIPAYAAVITPPTTDVSAKMLNSNIVGGPTVISKINGMDELDAVIADGVTTTVMIDFTNLDDASDLLQKVANKNLAMFVIDSVEDALELGAYLNQTANSTAGYTDTHVASTDPTVLRVLRETAGRVRASLIVEYEITMENYPQVVYTANACYALNIIVSADNITRTVMEQVQRRMFTVWVVSDDTTVGNLDVINMGSNGVITENAAQLKADAAVYTTRTLVRRPYYVAHRGLPSAAPENTLPAYELAIAAGADLVECDIYLTKDGEIILLHDDYFNRTTDIAANWTTLFSDEERAEINRSASQVRPQDLTLEQIKRLNAAAWSDNTFAPGANRTGWALKGYDFVEIPTLREVMLLLADTDVILVCELKDTRVAHVTPAYEVIRQVSEEVGKDMYNQIVFISFQDAELTYMANNHPEASTGRLTAAGGLLGLTAGNARDILRAVLPIYCNGYNPTSSNLSSSNVPQVYARGLSVWAYTIDAVATARNHIDWGAYGITTNYCNRASTAVMGISAEKSRYITMPGESAVIGSVSLDYLKNDANISTEIVVIDGFENIIDVEGNEITVLPGTSATVMLRAQSAAGEFTNSYTLYSQPVTVTSYADDTALNAAIKAAEDFVNGDYSIYTDESTEAAINWVSAKLAELYGLKTAVDTLISQNDLDLYLSHINITAHIEYAKTMLVVRPIDDTTLNAAIQAAEDFVNADYSAYTDESAEAAVKWAWAKLAELYALRAAVDAETITQDDLDLYLSHINIMANLNYAQSLLVVKVDNSVTVTPSAFVTKMSGNQNKLTITVTEIHGDGTVNAITETLMISNNAAGTYQVGEYRVYVDTKGNDQIRACYIVE